ncbi:MAG: hypothetical protein DRO23_00915 [Thermoprotei archaeon]|nr:MAG: hypothetical protein DRO23_00915 [Thermoprotei archaeon]
MKLSETVKVKYKLLKRKLMILKEVFSIFTFISEFTLNSIAKKTFPIKLKTNASVISFIWRIKPPPMMRHDANLNKMNRWR